MAERIFILLAAFFVIALVGSCTTWMIHDMTTTCPTDRVKIYTDNGTYCVVGNPI